MNRSVSPWAHCALPRFVPTAPAERPVVASDEDRLLKADALFFDAADHTLRAHTAFTAGRRADYLHHKAQAADCAAKALSLLNPAGTQTQHEEIAA